MNGPSEAEGKIPPRPADALLKRWLPEGIHGESIIGDLHQEYDELIRSKQVVFPQIWYWRSTLALLVGFALYRSGHGPSEGGATRSRRDRPTVALLSDFRFGLRMLMKTPLLSAIAILTIGLGVGLTTQTFSAVYGSIVRGLPVPGEERLMHIDENVSELGIESTEMSIHDFLDLRDQQRSFEDVAAFHQSSANLAGDDGLPERFMGAYVSANALSHLGVPPLLGRTFMDGEDDPDAQPLVVLGYHVWTNRFSQDPQIIGKSVRVNGETTEIIGVMPDGFRFPFREDLWLTHRLDAAALPRGAGDDLDVFGRLREGVSVEVAREELRAIAGGMARRFPETNDGVGMDLRHYEVRFMPQEIRAVLWVMLLSTFGVLLIACANVANLLLARASLRTREVAIRSAMGASRVRVVRQLMMESLILAVLGGLLGLFLSAWGLGLYNQFAAGIYRPYWIDPGMDVPVLLFCLGVTGAASLAAGFFPAMRASGVGVAEVLKDGSRSSSSLRMGRFSSALVIGEIAVSSALLVGAGFMIQSVVNVGRIDLGFDPSQVITARIGLFEAEYPGVERRDQFFDALKERLEAEPGTESVSLGTHLPGLGSFIYYVAVEGEPYPGDADYPAVNAVSVSSDYFKTFGVELLRGRDFHALETRVGGEPVVIVNRSFVDQYLGGDEALGKRIRLGVSNSQEPWMRVVGVVPDMHVGGGVGGLGDDRRRKERIFVPKGLYDHRGYAIAVRTERDLGVMGPRLREVVAELDPNLPIYDLTPLDDGIKQATWAFKLFGVQFSIFGALALFMAAVGLYGVMAFSVNQRRREMGVRMALGAEPSSLFRLVLEKGAIQLAIGTSLGVVMGAVLGKAMGHILYGVETGDPRIYLLIVGTLSVAGLLACVLPARMATRADPLESMRVT
jgi:putative ABC transport system permease protein